MSAKRSGGKTTPPALDRHALYELCAQSPARDVKVLRAILGGEARRGRVLGEDFCGTAAVSRAWAELGEGYRAVGVDHDAATLARATPHGRVKLVRADVMAVNAPADLIAVLNFSIAELHERSRLVSYLKHARKRLRPRGAFVCDIYGGSDAYLTGELPQRFTGPRGEKIQYAWEQRTADPFAGRVVNAMHFSVRGRERGAKATEYRDAFIYDWRLWSVPELRDAMRDAGFSTTQVYARQPDAIDADGAFHVLPLEDATELGDSFSVYVVGRR